MAPNNIQKPPRLSMESLQRTISDISFELISIEADNNTTKLDLPPITEVEDAKCECCGMSEECTLEYIARVRDKFSGKMICGLCGEAVKEEMVKSGSNIEEALKEHMNACARFNRLGRAYPVLGQAEGMREILKRNRVKSLSPKDKSGHQIMINRVGIARSSSCIAAIVKVINNQEMVK